MSKTRKQDKDGIYKRKDSPYYWASYIDASGKRARRSTKSESKTEATAILAKWTLEAFRETTWDEKPVPGFEEMLLRYLKKRDISSSQRTAAGYLRDYFGGRSALLTGGDVEKFKAFHQRPLKAKKGRKKMPKGRAPATINKMLGMLSAALCEWNLLEETNLPNPVSGRKMREPDGRVRWITDVEASRLIEAAKVTNDHLANAVALTLYTGMRRQELLTLEWSDVDLEAGLIHLRAKNTKTGRDRTLPLSEDAKCVVDMCNAYRAKHCPQSKWVICSHEGKRFKDLKTSFKTAKKKAGIKKFRWHDMRHTYAAWLVTAGSKLAVVRDLLGHRSVKETERYAHLAPENLRAAVQHLPNLSHVQVTLTNSEGESNAVSH